MITIASIRRGFTVQVSVVINTWNRAAALRQTLIALRQQQFRNFEVVVVNGPSTDDTATILQSWSATVRSVDCPKPQLALSRNLGIQAAAGDIVAFLDDDAIPEPTWLAELTAAYDSPQVGAVGGIVFDHTGTKLQNRYAACRRNGETQWDLEPPLDRYSQPGADPFLYLQGTNMSYARSVLAAIGGFDENILHYYDDVETCLQVIDHGYKVRALPRAAVHHKYLPSHIRNQSRLLLDPYRYLCDNAYFANRHGRTSRSAQVIHETLCRKVAAMKAEAAEHRSAGRFTPEQQLYHDRRLDEALRDGTVKGLTQNRLCGVIATAKPTAFRPFLANLPVGRRRKFVWLLSDAANQAWPTSMKEAALQGDEPHLITLSEDGSYRLDIVDGVWVHCLPEPVRWCPEIERRTSKEQRDFKQMAAVYLELCKIAALGEIDGVILAPGEAWGQLAALDPRFPIVKDANVEAEPHSDDSSVSGATALRTVVKRWATALRQTHGFSPRRARRTARRLLNPERYPIDYPAEIGKLWDRSEEDCLRELYALLLGRRPNPAEVEHWQRVAQHRSMADVVRSLAQSQEAGKRDIPTDWVHELIPALGRREPGATQATSLARRLRNGLFRVPLLGKALRLLG